MAKPMKQKVNTWLAIALIIVLSGTVAFFTWSSGERQSQTQQSISVQPIAQTNNSNATGAQQQSQSNSQNKLIYKNTEFGFQLSLPKGWEAYKTSVDKSDGIINILFYLPTTEKMHPDRNKELKGYADIFSIIIFTTSEWNKQLNSTKCKTVDGSLGCFYPKDIIGKNNTYVFSDSFANSVPDDLRNIQQQMIDSSFLEKNFKLL